MYQREIGKEIIDSISLKEFVNNIEKDRFGHYVLNIDQKDHLLRIFYRKEIQNIVIITAYKTSKSTKYKN